MYQQFMKPSEFDTIALRIIRENIKRITDDYILPLDIDGKKILEIGPSDLHNINFLNATHHTLDISQDVSSTFCADICSTDDVEKIKGKYDVILLFEVLEHVSNPFKALQNLRTKISDDGFLYITTPFNFRIHGPLPDNWRFTVHGIKELLKQSSWEVITIDSTESNERPLMPIHYFTIATPS